MSGEHSGGLRFSEQDMSAGQVLAFAHGDAAVFSNRCPGKATPNEDAAALIPVSGDRGLLVVADGLGGRPGGETAAALVVGCIEQAVSAAGSGGDSLRAPILDGIEAANRRLLELATGAATTLAVVEIDGETLRPYHVGDSEILVVGQRGRVKLETVSHSPVGYAVEAGVLHPEDALHHDDRHLISNVVGDSDMRIEVGSPLRLAPRDTVLLASDGLCDNLLPQEIIETVRKGPLRRVAAALVGTSAERMAEPRDGLPSKPDDVSFIVFRRRPTRSASRRKPAV